MIEPSDTISIPHRRKSVTFSSGRRGGLPGTLLGGVHIRYLALVDGEHYPPVIEDAVRELQTTGEVCALLFLGGTEKLPVGGLEVLAGVEVISGPDTFRLLEGALVRFAPDEVRDLSDAPVVDYRRRFALASVALFHGVSYAGAGFAFAPPARPRIATIPSVAVIGTGKRTGKTAVAGFAARTLVGSGRRPVVVAMGRGGPPSPEVLRGDEVELGPQDLLALADEGRHAASDYVEDALLARVPTVGCRRCGGGVAGNIEFSNVPEGVAVANGLGGDLMLVEGSGSSIPPVHADSTVLVVPAGVDLEDLKGYFGPYRLLLSDFAVVTMCEDPFGSPSRISEVVSLIQDAYRSAASGRRIEVVRTVFRPSPTRSIEGARVFVTTTAPEAVGSSMKVHLERQHRCKVVGISHALSDRPRLLADLDGSASDADVILCEIKAAAIDVATRWGLDRGREVVYMDNALVGIEGDDPEALILDAANLADRRHREGTDGR